MRRVLMCGVAFIAMTAGAGAADMPDFLRGSQQIVMPGGGARWDGFYVGGHVGWSTPGIDFTNNTADVADLISPAPIRSRTSTPLENQSSSGTHVGGFIGYNSQWDGAVFGFEGTYNWIGRTLTAPNTIFGAYGPPADAMTYTAAGSVDAKVVDYATVRLRGGWAATSWWMPYATAGLALGRMDITRTAVLTPSASATTPVGTFVPPPVAFTESLNNQLGYGYALGVGSDFCVFANLFVRAEYEYVQFTDFQGLNAHIHNMRIGAGLKF